MAVVEAVVTCCHMELYHMLLLVEVCFGEEESLHRCCCIICAHSVHEAVRVVVVVVVAVVIILVVGVSSIETLGVEDDSDACEDSIVFTADEDDAFGGNDAADVVDVDEIIVVSFVTLVAVAVAAATAVAALEFSISRCSGLSISSVDCRSGNDCC